MIPLLEVSSLSHRFRDVTALKDVRFTLDPGHILGLVGPNGAGKTTLLRILAGLLPPDTGSVRILGQELSCLDAVHRAGVAFVPSGPGLFPGYTALKLAAWNRQFYPVWDDVRFTGLLQHFRLDPSRKIREYSLGMRGILALSLALAQKPRLLLLDEPLTGLDPRARLDIIHTLLEDFSGHEDTAMVISSHYLEELERLCDRVVFLDSGQIRADVELEPFREEARTIRCVFQKEPPEHILSMEGITSVTREGRLGYLIRTGSNFPEIYEALSQVPHYVIEVSHRNLQDLWDEEAGRKESRFHD